MQYGSEAPLIHTLDVSTKMVPLEECNREWKPTDPRFDEDLALVLGQTKMLSCDLVKLDRS